MKAVTALVLMVEVADTERKLRQEYTFEISPIRVGRSPLNDLPLDRSFVSHCHGVLRFDAGRCDFMDLGSTNGTYVSGSRLSKNQPVPLGTNTVLMIGTLELRVRLESAPRDRARASASYAFRPSDINLPVAERQSPAPPPHALPTPALGHVIDAGQGGGSGQAHGSAGSERPWGSSAGSERGESLASLFANYRASWTATMAAVMRDVPSGVSREAYGQRLLAEYPELAQESEFRRWLGTDRGALSSPPRPSNGRVQSGLGRALGLGDAVDDVALAERAAKLLERFAQTFLELRRGQRQLATEVGGTPPADDTLSTLADARSVLSFLLDLRTSNARIDELSRAYADLMLHQVALINGFHAGARELVSQLSPDAIEVIQGSGALGFVMRLFGRDRRMSLLRQRVEDLSEETTFSSVLMGRAFARAYAAAMGQTADTAKPPPNRARVGRS
jgi:type VI secretion system protein ImpI